jgi:NAD(P)-dependent dehydrogenase (short-subunit alcohol dehydrogenase family)
MGDKINAKYSGNEWFIILSSYAIIQMRGWNRMDHNGQTAVITGAGRGIGRGIALRCAHEGMNVVLAGYTLEPLNTTAQELEALGVKTLVVQTDVSMLDQVETLADQSFAEFGEVHLLVNNAGVANPGRLLDISMDDWQWVMGVNFFGVLYGLRAFAPRMMAQESESRIVNVASIMGLIPATSSYAVSKHAVVALTEAYYQEFAENAPHVHITAYCPGWVSTELDTVARSRPDHYGENPPLTEETKKGWRESLAGGVSIEEAADFLFEGIAEEKLYIGPRAFEPQLEGIREVIAKRSRNIADEVNL